MLKATYFEWGLEQENPLQQIQAVVLSLEPCGSADPMFLEVSALSKDAGSISGKPQSELQ